MYSTVPAPAAIASVTARIAALVWSSSCRAVADMRPILPAAARIARWLYQISTKPRFRCAISLPLRGLQQIRRPGSDHHQVFAPECQRSAAPRSGVHRIDLLGIEADQQAFHLPNLVLANLRHLRPSTSS